MVLSDYKDIVEPIKKGMELEAQEAIMTLRQDRLCACGRISPANALNPGVSQLWEADPGGILAMVFILRLN